MGQVFNRNLNDEVIAFWFKELTPYYGPLLDLALTDVMREKYMPSVNEVIERHAVHLAAHRKSIREAEEYRQREEERRSRMLSPEEEAVRNKAADEFFAKMREALGYDLREVQSDARDLDD